jgi:hypothetical protein
MSIPLSIAENALELLAAAAMERIDGLKAEVAAKDTEIELFRERIAHLEEAQASVGVTRTITKQEWQENFK